MEERRYRKGKMICAEASEGAELYYVLSGSVRIYKTINAEEVELGVLGKHDFVGELSLLLSTPRTASVEAAEDTVLLCLSKEALFAKIRADSAFAERLITSLAQKVAQSNEVISELEGVKRSLEIIYGVKKATN